MAKLCVTFSKFVITFGLKFGQVLKFKIFEVTVLIKKFYILSKCRHNFFEQLTHLRKEIEKGSVKKILWIFKRRKMFI